MFASVFPSPKQDLFLALSTLSYSLDNRLQLPRIAQRILNNRLIEVLLVAIATVLGIGPSGPRSNRREVDMAISNSPAATTGEVDDGALGVQE